MLGAVLDLDPDVLGVDGSSGEKEESWRSEVARDLIAEQRMLTVVCS